MGLDCANLYDSLFIENDGYIYPCFHTTSKLGSSVIKHDGVAEHIDSISPARVLASDSHAEMRSLMREGKWPNPCATCRLAENKGTKSHRRKDAPTVKLRHIHVRVGNKCNLRCIMCGPGSSNQWYDFYPAVTGQTNFNVSDFTYGLIKSKNGFILDSDNFNFSDHDKIVEIVNHHSSDLESITFHGGEPFLSKSHNKIIQSLVSSGKASNIDLSYHSNLTILPAVLNEMRKFKSVHITISLDGVGSVNDAIRWPSKYDQIIENFKKLRIETNFLFSVNHTLSILNYEHLPEFLQEMEKLELSVTLNPVHNPIYASASILSNDQRIRLLDKLSAVADINLVKGPLNINYNDTLIRQHRQMFNRLWELSNKDQDWDLLFPFMSEERKSWG